MSERLTRRVVVVHNWYRSDLPSGENESVAEEVAGLERLGVEVELFGESSDEVLAAGGRARWGLAGAPFGLPRIRRRFSSMLASFRPDAVLLENLWPFISPAVIRPSWASGAAVCAGVRNYRLSCIAGTHQREGRPCTQCSPSWKLPGILHGCLWDSPLISTPVALSSQWYARPMLSLDRYFANSEFTASYLRGLGVPDGRIVVRENAVPDPALSVEPVANGRRSICFAGRLSSAKGADLLLDAWEMGAPPELDLVIVGDGAERARAERLAARDDRVTVMGNIARSALPSIMAASTCVVVPSVWNEPFGRVAVEAMAVGRPVVVSDRGALPSLVKGEVGRVVSPRPEVLNDVFRWVATENDDVLARMGRSSRRQYEERFRPEVNLRVLLDGLNQAVLDRERRA